MPLGIKRFWRPDRTEFPGVVVPLAHSSAPAAQSQCSPVDEKNATGSDNQSISKSLSNSEKGVGIATSLPDYSQGPMTIESLRAYVESDLVATGAGDTAYDRMFPCFIFHFS